MAAAFFRRRRQPTPDTASPPLLEPARPPAPAPAHAPPHPPRSYAQLADIADEIVATSWDPNLPLETWLNGVRQIAIEGHVYRNEGNHDMAFVRMATAVKLLRDVLPYHHVQWRSLEQAQLAAIQKQYASASATHASLKSHLIARTAAYYASSSSRPSSAAPALLLRNTVTTAATVYRDRPAHSLAPVTPVTLPAVHPRRAPAPPPAPPRANRIRAAFGLGRQGLPTSTDGGTLPAPGALPAPGDDGDALTPGAADELLLPREMGRRIPKLGEAVAPPSAMSGYAVAPTQAYARGHLVQNALGGGGPMPLPGEGDSEGDDDGENEAAGGGASAQSKQSKLAAVQVPVWDGLGPQATAWPPTGQTSLQAVVPPSVTQTQRPYAAPAYPAYPPTPSAPPLSHGHYLAAPVHPTYHAPQTSGLQQQPQPAQPVPPLPPAPPAPPVPPRPSAMLGPPVPPAPPAPPTHPRAVEPPALAPPPGAVPSPRPSAPPSTPTPPPLSLPSRSSAISARPVPSPSAPSPARSAAASPPALGAGAGLAGAKSLSMDLSLRGLGALELGAPVQGQDRRRGEEEAGTRAVARTESGAPLRPVILPSRLISHFMHAIAADNTARNIETCGLLLGELRAGAFHVTHLLVPKQEGTADTCAATHDDETFAVQASLGLLTLGW
ncbi:hypothetical protein JCM3770_003522, partial [Rhodotorula araucariae]